MSLQGEADLANITLVDDDENIVASVSLALESHGHKITAYHLSLIHI